MNGDPGYTHWEFQGNTGGAIKGTLYGVDYGGSMVNARSINLTPFTEVRITISATAGYNSSDYCRCGVNILDTSKKIIKDMYSGGRGGTISYGNTGITETKKWDISDIREQAFIELIFATTDNRRITFSVTRIEFVV